MLNVSNTLPEGVTLIVLTGGPSAGKSTFSVRLREWLEEAGFRVAVAHEGATDLITSGLATTARSFQEVLLVRILQNEQTLAYLLSQQESEKDSVLICDRGALDAIAYIGANEFTRLAQNLGLTVQMLRDRYRAVVHLVTAADGAEEFYTTENNEAREETPEEARERDKKVRDAWITHNRFLLVPNEKGYGFDMKMKKALKQLMRVLGMPEPLEAEHKYLWLGAFSMEELLPFSPQVVHIQQTYLIPEGGTANRRVRTRTLEGATSYYYAEKRPTGQPGVRVERERAISEDEYLSLLEQQAPATRRIMKDRHVFVYEGRQFELDVYRGHLEGLVTLEVEVDDMSDPVRLPPHWPLREVTGDPEYDNASLALTPPVR